MLKDMGYITAQAGNAYSQIPTYNKEDDLFIDQMMQEPADHEFFLFDPQYLSSQNIQNIHKVGYNSKQNHCIYGKRTAEIVFEYGQKFLNEYKDIPKYLFMQLIDGNDILQENIQNLDDSLVEFLKQLEKDILSRDTAVLLMSQNGQNNISPIFSDLDSEINQNKDFNIEEDLPLLQMLVSKNVIQKFELQDVLEENEQQPFAIDVIRNSILTAATGPFGIYQLNYQKQHLEQVIKLIKMFKFQ